MIRYAVTPERLEELIEEESPGWLEHAAARTEQFRALGRYEEPSSIWSKVKPVYMRLQQGKCAFCEREMERERFGRVEQDVEHFRPKGNVKPWKLPASLVDQGVEVSEVPPDKGGYYLLPYHPFNYAASCKPCNSTLKSDYFPIAGEYSLEAENPRSMKAEKPFLIYPIGDLDDDPESLIAFNGASPVPVAKRGHKRNRALVTIEFFQLDNPKERVLYRDRSMLIMALQPLLEKATTGTEIQRSGAQAKLDQLITPKLRHLNCARSFIRLFEADRKVADAVYDAAVELVVSGS